MSTTLIERSSSSQSRLGPKRTERRLYAVGILALALHLLITALAGPATTLVGVGLIGALTAAALAPYSRLRRRTRVA
jgi:Flp pilus assembly protein TadB